jgi:hypothetical protein
MWHIFEQHLRSTTNANHRNGTLPGLAIYLLYLFGFIALAGIVPAQQIAPATPLIAHDPYFSVWSTTDLLSDSDTTHWTGNSQTLTGIARIDGIPYRFMGRYPDRVHAMKQIVSAIAPTHTDYEFSQSGVTLRFSFFTPALTNDLDILSRPVTYLTWEASSNDGAPHQVSVMLDVNPEIAVNDAGQHVVTSRNNTATLDVLSVGSRDQAILNRSGDNLRIDWGYFHLATPKHDTAFSAIGTQNIDTFVRLGNLSQRDTISMPRSLERGAAHLAVVLDFGAVSASPVSRHVLVSYTEDYAIQYMQQNLRPYWQRNNMPVEELLDTAEGDYAQLERRGRQFDAELTADLVKVGGKHYAEISVLAYRQTLAAHKLVADSSGAPMYFSKENFSNGCIATVDVMYPSAPFFLLLQPKLLEAELLPVLEYASLPRWHFPYSPHDLGQYPLANGQVYGGGEKSEDRQMPVEESGNMLILVDAVARAEGNSKLAERFWPKLTEWAEYLKNKGLDPENQLTTDDFAGHVAHNANLSIKAIEALAAYADLARLSKRDSVADEYIAAAKSMAGKWVTMAREGNHYKLAFDSPGTWSQKYNLVWDKVLGYDLFPRSVQEAEIAFYLSKINRYGLPLDGRADYTKLDWTIWTATLSSTQEQFDAFVDPLAKWIRETPTRVPMTDWYDTKSGEQVGWVNSRNERRPGFQARSVVGGVYMKALSDKELTAKWRAKSVAATSY